VPEDRLLVETDAPYLAPVPFRGKTNEPAFVRFVAGCLAEIRQQAPERIAEVTAENFFNLFKNSRNTLDA
jgi:TatD DNase family protein